MFSSPQENEPTTLTTKTCIILSLLVCREEFIGGYQSKVISFNSFRTSKSTLLYIYFPNFEYRIFLKDLNSTLPGLLRCDFVITNPVGSKSDQE